MSFGSKVLTFVVLCTAVACDGGGGSEDRATTILGLTGDAANGETVYADNCATCHGADATGGIGPAIAGKELDEIVETSLVGVGDEMPAFDTLADQDIADLAAYVNGL